MVPAAVKLQARQAGVAAVLAVHHMVRLAARRRAGRSRRGTGTSGPAGPPAGAGGRGCRRSARRPAAATGRSGPCRAGCGAGRRRRRRGRRRSAGRWPGSGAPAWPAPAPPGRPARPAGLPAGRPGRGPRWSSALRRPGRRPGGRCSAGPAGLPVRRWSYRTHRPISCSTAPGSRSPVTTGTSIASQATRRAASPSSQAPPSPVLTDAAARWAAHRARYPAIHASCSLESDVQLAQVGERHVDQGLDRLPGPLRQQAGGQQPLHRLGQRVVVALRPGPQVPGPGRGRQGVQDGLDHGGALGGQVAAQDPGAVQGGVQEQRPVQAPGPGRRGPAGRSGTGSPRRSGQRPQVRPGPGRGDEDLLGLGRGTRPGSPGSTWPAAGPPTW